MYTFGSRIRYSETDEYGKLTLTGIMNYLQDCSTFQSEDIGLGISYLTEHHQAWWLSSWQIVIDRYPCLGERIWISTYPHGFKGIYGYRNFLIRDESGAVIVKADSSWFFYDLEKGCPARVTPNEIRGYGECEAPLLMHEAPKKILFPENYWEGKPVEAARHHLDTNLHVNNAQYAEIAREFLPENFEIQELRVEYKKAAVLGDQMIPRIGREEDGYTVSLVGKNGTPFANMYLKGRCFGGQDEQEKRKDG